MRYFRYKYSGSLGLIWQLFAELKDAPEECLSQKDRITRCDYGHTEKIINSAMNGKLFDDNFSLKDYEYKCQSNDKITRFKNSQKVLSIVTDEMPKDSKRNIGTIRESQLKVSERVFETIDSKSDIDKNIERLFSIREDYIVNKGLDPVVMLRNSLRGIPEAIKIMKGTQGDKELNSIIQALLEAADTKVLLSKLVV